MELGLGYERAHDLPVGELMDYITIAQIMRGKAKLKEQEDDEDIIPNVR